jgi:hypothetical protein
LLDPAALVPFSIADDQISTMTLCGLSVGTAGAPSPFQNAPGALQNRIDRGEFRGQCLFSSGKTSPPPSSPRPLSNSAAPWQWEDRIAYIRAPRWIGHHVAKQAHERLSELLSRPPALRTIGLMLVGRYANGKQ